MNLTSNPNFTIVLPGGCNANCSFCFWRKQKQSEYNFKEKYLDRLVRTLDALPNDFWQISISGGEPTISPMYHAVLDIIDKQRFPKVVLTTNGVREFEMHPKINHVNISRHHWSKWLNDLIFNCETMTTIQIKKQIEYIHENNADVTINTVYNDNNFDCFDSDQMISFVKRIGADRLCMRKESTVNSDLGETMLESFYHLHEILYSGGCPVCRSKTQIINGVNVTWKASLLEPSEHMEDIYELIYHPNGVISNDLQGKNSFTIKEVLQMCAQPEPRKRQQQKPSTKYAGCGGSGQIKMSSVHEELEDLKNQLATMIALMGTVTKFGTTITNRIKALELQLEGTPKTGRQHTRMIRRNITQSQPSGYAGCGYTRSGC